MKINKNLHVVAFVAAMMALGAQATPVSSDDAVRAVTAWSSAKGAAFANPGIAERAEAVCDDGGSILYWIVSMSNGGAVVVSPDTELDPIVSVLNKYPGSFPAGHPLPYMLKHDMSGRLAALANGGISEGAKEAAKAQWKKYGVPRTRAPLLKGASLADGDSSKYVRRIVDGFEEGGRYTHWNQEFLNGKPCYNKDTPNNYPCGCVATAGAAILQFFNCTNDPGEVASTKTSVDGRTKSYSTKEGENDWTILPAAFGGEDDSIEIPDDDGYELLGRVCYNLGVLVDMQWAANGSGASTEKLAAAFKTYGFTTARYVKYSGATDTDGREFMKTLYGQLWCGAPVVLSIGAEDDDSGHAVVACGYARDADGDEFCRIFMGWGGSGDAWYKFPKIGSEESSFFYDMIKGAVTMIGYEDDAVVPVYGDTNIPDVDLTLPGYMIDDAPVTVHVDENCFFGIRVPMSLADKRLVYSESKSIGIAPFIFNVISNETAALSDLEAALPDEVHFPLVNMTLKQTMASGMEVAERDGKALLVVSGTPGTDRSKLIEDYLYELDDTTDLSNRFVYVYVKTSTAGRTELDGNPSIAVFDPSTFDPEGRWEQSNGVLDYDNFIDYEAYSNLLARVDAEAAEGAESIYSKTNDVPYVFSADDATEMTNRLDRVLEVGYDLYSRRHSGIVVNVEGINLAKREFDEAVAVDPAYGMVTDSWTNGETAVFSALGTYTNEEDGVIYSCVGWTTNAIPRNLANLTNYVEGAEAQIQLFSDTTNTLTWVWDVTHYRVTAAPTLNYYVEDAADAVTPAESWVARGDRITITAQPEIQSYKFNQWEAYGGLNKDRKDYTMGTVTQAAYSENGTTVSFFVNEPVDVKANYSPRATPKESTEYTLTVHSTDEAESRTTPPLTGGYAWGENTTCDNVFKVDFNAMYVDATGGVWKCSNAKFTPSARGVGDGAYQFTSSLDVEIEWEFQPDIVGEPDPGPGPEPGPEPGPTPTDITITGIEQAADGSWTITVSGAVKDCWYWLYSSDDLAALSGDEWTAEKAVTTEGNPQKAAADGDVVFTTTSDGVKRFWRAKATSKEDGD